MGRFTSFISGDAINQLIQTGEYRFDVPDRKPKVGSLVWWGADDLFIFRANGRLWMFWVAGEVTPTDGYQVESIRSET